MVKDFRLTEQSKSSVMTNTNEDPCLVLKDAEYLPRKFEIDACLLYGKSSSNVALQNNEFQDLLDFKQRCHIAAQSDGRTSRASRTCHVNVWRFLLVRLSKKANHEQAVKTGAVADATAEGSDADDIESEAEEAEDESLFSVHALVREAAVGAAQQSGRELAAALLAQFGSPLLNAGMVCLAGCCAHCCGCGIRGW
jgi:hypothetical protein